MNRRTSSIQPGKNMPVLSEIFEECPRVRIIEIFSEKQDEMLCLTDIERSTGITRTTIANHISKLLKEGIIEKKIKNGRKQFYQLNVLNPKVKILLRLEDVIISEKLGDLIKENEVEYTEKSEIKSENTMLNSEKIDYIEVPNPNIQNSSTYTISLENHIYTKKIERTSDYD